ncbi:probable G-protein coupled receptor Mth-like 3 [Argonauta hians]
MDTLPLYLVLAISTLILADDKCGNHKCVDHVFNQSHHFELQGCFCDSTCVVYGDCCVNYNAGYQSTQYDYGRRQCVKLGKQNRSVMMVTTCSKSYSRDAKIIQNCVEDTGHPAWGVPVTGAKSSLIYKNMFCAVCNDESNYTFWNIRLECPKKINTTRLNKIDQNLDGCRKIMFNLDNLHEHTCDEKLISKCPRGSKDKENVIKCRDSSYGVIYDKYGNMYKNIYCFNCHLKKTEDIICTLYEPLTVDTGETKSLSFIVLINFNQQHPQNNPSNMVYMDPCKDDEELTNGACRKVVKPSKDSPECLKVKLNKHEYKFLENGTLFYYATQTYHSEEYYSNVTKDGQSDVYICKDLIADSDVTKVHLVGTKTEAYLSYVCSIISLVALIILILKFLYYRNVRKLSGFIYVSFAVALFIAQLLFVLFPRFSRFDISSCRAVAVAMHYAFLASFFWLNAITVNIWLSVRLNPCRTKKHSEKRSFFTYSLYSWLSPILLVLPAILMDKYIPNSKFAPNYGINEFCWINKGWSILLFFAGPLGVIILINFILYIQTACTIHTINKFTRQHSDKNDAVTIFINVKLCLLTGITWIIGYIAVVTNSIPVRIAFVFLNSSFGLWVAISFLFSRNIFSKMKQKIKTLTESGE